MSNRRIWDRVHKPDPTSLKTIGGGRLKGMTDINPQWRFQAATDVFGPCGVGWWYTIKDLWNVPGADGQVMAFARVDVFYRDGESTSQPVEGIGGSMMITNETKKEQQGDGTTKYVPYQYTNDECYKMAVTDALSVAFKALGFGAEIYAGRWDGSKYLEKPKPPEPTAQDKINSLPDKIKDGMKANGITTVKQALAFCEAHKWNEETMNAELNKMANNA
jgi:hypothetical protein